MGRIDQRMKELGLELPPPWSPRGAFLPFQREGSLVFLSGQICEWNGPVTCEGPVGEGATSVIEAQEAAKICALNLIYALKLACEGDLDRVRRVMRLGGFVNCTPGFASSPLVINGATQVFIDVFGDAGRHARTAIGVTGLPGNAAVEVDAIVAID
jgi:enamine deaminase RidA (YjgF/YER057c/UK114 family)